MKFLLTALGSYGDVHPLVGLGKTLANRGHEVSVIANEHFDKVVEKAGINFIPFLSSEDYDNLSKNPNLWHQIKGPKTILEQGSATFLRPLYELLMQHVEIGNTVIVAHGLDFASRIIQEKHGVPVASVALAPLQIRSSIAMPNMPGFVTRHQPFMWPRKLQYWIADKFFADPILAGPINKLRAELGLTPPVQRVIDKWWYSPDLVLCMFPEWFAPKQTDWPQSAVHAGFPLWDEGDTGVLSDEVEAFLQTGDAPIVFAPGSAMRFGHDFFHAAVEACEKLNTRGILLTKYSEQIPKQLPECVRHFEFVSFSQLLPRSAAFVHHGGIGSSAQGLAAGIPHLVIPRNFDQPDNAQRLKDFGVAQVVQEKNFSKQAMLTALEKLLTQNHQPGPYEMLASRCNGEAALRSACEALEGIA